jgi:triosephosphate isomerase (TIM)
MREPRGLMVGNWKMHLTHDEATAHIQKLASALPAEALADLSVAALPPFTAIPAVRTALQQTTTTIAYGAQDLSSHDAGAFTGDVSGAMLASLGCAYVLVGHSERRQHHREDDGTVHAKVQAAFRHGLVPILCVGEGLDVRRTGTHVEFALAQLEAAVADLGEDAARSLVIAYEPVWAIGTGEVATPQDAQEVCGALRRRLGELYSPDVARNVRVLYGGSVKSTNIAEITAQVDVDGALVGGASLDPEEFSAVCRRGIGSLRTPTGRGPAR